ncbi:MAG: hypothetical protein JWP29_1937 [Rhodoferax sp.]|nr:hypothetical protein [Rhodoferax sp.]
MTDLIKPIGLLALLMLLWILGGVTTRQEIRRDIYHRRAVVWPFYAASVVAMAGIWVWIA